MCGVKCKAVTGRVQRLGLGSLNFLSGLRGVAQRYISTLALSNASTTRTNDVCRHDSQMRRLTRWRCFHHSSLIQLGSVPGVTSNLSAQYAEFIISLPPLW